ncbi:MAG: hypothetical protein HC904_01430 [Blastochloris sp.]|nr:hypothetical protein [Blastochloris sp.]
MNGMEADLERLQFLREQRPANGLLLGRESRLSPTAFPLTEGQIDFLEKLGPRLLTFLQACNLMYRQSAKGKGPGFLREWLDAGKPAELLELGLDPAIKNELPLVIRPDLLLTEEGFALSEIDSLPGGIGMTAWLGETYAALGEDVVGGGGMREAMRRLFPEGDVLIAEEGREYGPEFEWLFGQERVKRAEGYVVSEKPIYRFVEAFDWPELGSLRTGYRPGVTRMTPPLKPFLEEKLWLALFWLEPLRERWRRELGDRYDRDLRQLIPYSWVVNPEPLPVTAVLPQLNVHSWEQVKQFSQKERELILKISGFSPLAWGSRGVTLGSDVSGEEWARALEEALTGFRTAPYLMQRYAKPKLVEHPYWSEEEGALRMMKGRVRLCPYYFVEEGEARLKGVLATVNPADKKSSTG